MKTSKRIRSLLPIMAALLAVPSSHGAISATGTFSSSAPPTPIRDGDLSGLLQSINVTGLTGNITGLSVTLDTVGGWNGDLYAYLWHDGVISVLLNRVGRTALNDSGSAGTGMSVTFDDHAIQDVHTASFAFGNPLVGTFSPDARNIAPDSVLDSTSRTHGLSGLIGLLADGEYRLFIADVATGDEATLSGWSVSIQTSPIPEPGSALFAMAILTTALVGTRSVQRI